MENNISVYDSDLICFSPEVVAAINPGIMGI